MNGVGPYWFPSPVRRVLTKVASLYFDEASWNKHDEGYYKRNPDRATCDFKFLQALLRDSSKKDSTLKVTVFILVSYLVWIIVRLAGWSAYNRTRNEWKYR